MHLIRVYRFDLKFSLIIIFKENLISYHQRRYLLQLISFETNKKLLYPEFQLRRRLKNEMQAKSCREISGVHSKTRFLNLGAKDFFSGSKRQLFLIFGLISKNFLILAKFL